MLPLLAYARPDLPRDGGPDPRPPSSTLADAKPSLVASAGAPAPAVSANPGQVGCVFLSIAAIIAICVLAAIAFTLATGRRP